MSRILFVLLLFVLSGSLPLGAHAAGIVVTSSVPGVFEVRGENFAAVAAIDLTLRYDPKTVNSFAVSWGNLVTGALSVNHQPTPGILRLAIIKTQGIDGSGPIATLRSTSAGSLSAGIFSLEGQLTDPSGVRLPVVTRIENPPPLAIPPPVADEVEATPPAAMDVVAAVPVDDSEVPAQTRSSGSSGSLTVLPREFGDRGTQTRPQPDSSQEKNFPEPQGDVDERDGIPDEAPAKAGEEDLSGKDGSAAMVEMTNPLRRFKEYRGTRDLTLLMSFFDPLESAPVTQIPSIAISDGKSAVTVAIDGRLFGETFDFAVANAEVLSSGQGPRGERIFEVLPKKGVWESNIVVLGEGWLIDIPLIVVPHRPQAFPVESTWGGADLNGDGGCDWVDDYIFVANHLLSLHRATGALPSIAGGKKPDTASLQVKN